MGTANLLFVNLLLDGGKADPQLQGRAPKLQQFLTLTAGFAVPLHGDEILASTMFSVNLAQPNQYILARDYKCINRRMIADWKCIVYAFHATVRDATEGDVIHAPEIVNPDNLPLSALLRFQLQL